jgi:hypothetical protein
MSAHVHVPTPAPTRQSAVLREILFPTDLSPESARAFEYARLLANASRPGSCCCM